MEWDRVNGMNLNSKKFKKCISAFIVLCLVFGVCVSFAVSAAPVASLSFLPIPMDEDSGEIRVYVRLRMINPPAGIDFDGVNKLAFSIEYDTDAFELKIDDYGNFFYLADRFSAWQDGIRTEINDESSFTVAYEHIYGDFVNFTGSFAYFILIARNPQRLFHSNDMYPLRFINGSVYYRMQGTERDEIIRIRDIAVVPCMVGGWTPDPPPQIPTELLMVLSEGDLEWRAAHLPPFAPPNEILMHVDSNRVVVDGITSLLDVAPFIDAESDLTFVPVRFLAEEIGFDIEWIAEESLVIARLGENVIHVVIGERNAFVNGVAVEMDAPAVMMNWRTLVPLRFMAESVGYTVLWDGYTRGITLQNN